MGIPDEIAKLEDAIQVTTGWRVSDRWRLSEHCENPQTPSRTQRTQETFSTG
jgi:hypothetical protein